MKKQMIKPKLLEIGDTIGLVTPAAGVPQAWVEDARRALEEQGYFLKLASNVYSSHGYCAGRDQERAEALMKLWFDPEVDVIWCGRGGYGSGRLLPYLDFNQMQAYSKMFIGMSDITALHIAMGQELGLVSYLGPNLNHFFNIEKASSVFTHQNCWNFLSAPLEKHTYTYPQDARAAMQVIHHGVGEGILVGGNLSLITSLVGTPWQLDTQGAILILEEVNEAPYRIDRMLNQLELAGMLQGLAGMILGTFEHCMSPQPTKSLDLLTIFQEYFSHRQYPVLMGFPTGHVPDQVTLPLQCRARLDTGTFSVTLLESAVSV